LCISGPSSTTPSWGRCHISKLFFDGKWHTVTQIMPWLMA
jgi:hypothetical protein